MSANLPPAWRSAAEPLLCAWDEAAPASSAVENWHSILRPYLAVHRRLLMGLLMLLAVWHNHRPALHGPHRGLRLLVRSGLTQLDSDWLIDLGYRAPGKAEPSALQVNPGSLLAQVA